MAVTITMTEDEFREKCDEHVGVCLECGSERGECEPDAEKYHCDECDENNVMGLEQALICGHVEIV